MASQSFLQSVNLTKVQISSDDEQGPQAEQNMANGNAPSREEVSLRIEAAELRTENRFIQLDGKIDRLIDSVSNLSVSVREVKDDLKETRSEVKTDYKNTRWTLVLIALAALAIVFAAESNILSALQAGLAIKDSSTKDSAPTTKPPLRFVPDTPISKP
jgi:hypothetical protein